MNGKMFYRGSSGVKYFNHSVVRDFKKRSGCKMKTMSDGVIILSGWKSTRDGLVTFYAKPYKGTHESKSENGNTYLNYMVVVQNKRNFNRQIVSGLLNLTNKKLVISDLGIVLNPNASNGGYCGSFYKK